MIEGVKIKELTVYGDYRGDFREILKDDEGLMSDIRQISLSRTKPGIIKAFHWHKYQDDIFYVSKGDIKVVLYDKRNNSKTEGTTQVLDMGESYSPTALFIPRGVLHGYKVMGEKEAEVIYIMNNTYDPKNPDEERVPHDDPEVKFNWDSEDKKKVLIIGASGSLGKQLMKDFSKDYEVAGTYHKNQSPNLIHLDFTNESQAKEIISKINPQIIIISSAKTNVEQCETDPEDAYKKNILGLKNTINNSQGRKIVFYSTDAVFDGKKKEYSEEDIPNPVNEYGKSKLEAEKIVSLIPNSLIIRTSRLYSAEPASQKFINKVLSSLKAREPVRAPLESAGNSTLIDDVSKATLELVKRDRSGIYHIVAPDANSLYETALKVAEVFGLDKSLITPVDKDFFNTKVKRASCVLSTKKIANEGITLSSLKEGLEKVKSSQEKFKKLNMCRVCGGLNLTSYLNLGETPLANQLLSSRDTKEDSFPLNVLLCKDCYLSQLSIVVKPETLFKHYVYRSSISKSFEEHCKELANELNSSFLSSNYLVVDIASNDGCLLKQFKEKGNRVLGIEPAANIAKIANDQGIKTIEDFWSGELAEKIRREQGPAKVITAFNVLAHVDDVKSFVEAVRTLLSEDGFFIVEFPHLQKLIEKTAFDTIYHEHLSYFLLKPVKKLMEDNGMRLAKVEKFDIHGGSVRLYVEHAKMNRSNGSIEKAIQEEEQEGLYTPHPYLKLTERVKKVRDDLKDKLHNLKMEGKKVAGFGASAKGNTLLNFCQIDNTLVHFIFDDTPEKQNKFTPGANIDILHPKNLHEKNPDYLLILAWNLADEIMKKTQSYREKGGKYIIPIPEVKVI